MISQLLLSGAGMIDPSVPVGDFAFNNVYSGNSGSRTFFNTTFIVPDNWLEKDWTFEHYFSSSPDYNYAYIHTLALFVNDVLVYVWSTPKSPNYGNLNYSWFRDQSSARLGAFNLKLKAGDVVRNLVQGATRSGSRPFNIYSRLKRVT